MEPADVTGGSAATTAASYHDSSTTPAQHETAAKTFTFPIYPDGRKTIPARAAAAGHAGRTRFADALARIRRRRAGSRGSCTTFRQRARRRRSGVHRAQSPNAYLAERHQHQAGAAPSVSSPQFTRSGNFYARYSWPVEFVVRAIKEIGWNGLLGRCSALTPLDNMGQTLFEPPDVDGWAARPRRGSRPASMLARMNFAATLAANQKFNLGAIARAADRQTPDRGARLHAATATPAAVSVAGRRNELLDY